METAIVPLSVILYSSVFLHELGHIGACRAFGVKHGGIGVGIFWIFPVLYADVTNIWTLGKRDRTIVNLAGIFVQLLFSYSLFLTSFLIESLTLKYAGYAVFISALFQLNPFFRMDGYWILSDLCNTPNLLSKSNLLLSNFFSVSFVSQIFMNKRIESDGLKSSTLLIFTYGILNYTVLFTYILWSGNRFGDRLLQFPITVFDFLRSVIYGQLGEINLEVQHFYILVFYLLIFSIVRQIFNFAKMKYSTSSHKKVGVTELTAPPPN